jgi:hypothetical protein
MVMVKKGTKMIKVIRSVVGKDKVIFNDKLVDGTRSVKIWGIGYRYGPVIKALEAAGFSVKLVSGFNGRTRLHVV